MRKAKPDSHSSSFVATHVEEAVIEKIYGNLTGLKSSQTKALARLYRRRVPARQIYTRELIETMTAIATEIRRELAVLINRRGQITLVSVGSNGLDLPPTKKREAVSRLSGIRCVHVHPLGGGLDRDDLVTLAMHRFDLMAAVEVEHGDLRGAQLWLASLSPEPDEEGNLWRLGEPKSIYEGEKFDFESWIEELENEFASQAAGVAIGETEKALLVALVPSSESEEAVENRLEELRQLVKTAGAEVLDRIVQRRDKAEPATFIGKGKTEELALLLREKGANLAVVDAELSPSQQKNLEEILGVKVMDRPGIILDIFAQRAATREGKLQVELAQLNYLLPRLAGRGEALSRLGGGIGTRGPGETKLEVDRRRIRARITALEEEIDRIKAQRQAQRKSRARHGAIVVALVGYTNAGKSTLLNTLTNAEVLAENKLFATLDPTTRRLYLPDFGTVLLTDTVGFIQHLPHQLVAAFRATLEEVTEADLLLHVVDASHPGALEQVKAVHSVLRELHAADKPTITVLNKVDRLENRGLLRRMSEELPDAIAISAKEKSGLEELLHKIQERVEAIMTQRYQGYQNYQENQENQG